MKKTILFAIVILTQTYQSQCDFINLNFNNLNFDYGFFLRDDQGYIFGEYERSDIGFAGWAINSLTSMSFNSDYALAGGNSDVSLVNKKWIETPRPKREIDFNDYFIVLTYIFPLSPAPGRREVGYELSQVGTIPYNAIYLTGECPLYYFDKNRYPNNIELLVNNVPLELNFDEGKFRCNIRDHAGSEVELKFRKIEEKLPDRIPWSLDNIEFITIENLVPGQLSIEESPEGLDLFAYTKSSTRYQLMISSDLSEWDLYEDNIPGNGGWLKFNINPLQDLKFFKLIESLP